MTQVSVNRNCPASYFSPVLNGCSAYISVLPLEQVYDPGGGELMFETWFISEQNNITQVRSLTLFFLPNNQEMTGIELLGPEIFKQLQRNLPPGELMLN